MTGDQILNTLEQPLLCDGVRRNTPLRGTAEALGWPEILIGEGTATISVLGVSAGTGFIDKVPTGAPEEGTGWGHEVV